MVGEFCTGFTAVSWNLMYVDMGMDLFDLFDFSDAEIIKILGDCCVSKEDILPSLKKADWNLDRIIIAEKVLGVDKRDLHGLIGEYFILDNIDYKNMDVFDMKKYITTTYSRDDLIEKGSQQYPYVMAHYNNL